MIALLGWHKGNCSVMCYGKEALHSFHLQRGLLSDLQFLCIKAEVKVPGYGHSPGEKPLVWA